MNEIDIQNYYCEIIKQAISNRDYLKKVKFAKNYTTSASNLFDLCKNYEYELFQDTSEWNNNNKFMVEISGKMTPDIVIRSKNKLKQNRIIMEVKYKGELTHGKHDSQIIRYFLNLIATSFSNKHSDIERGIILIAPQIWFPNDKWQYFVNTYSDLSKSFGITLAEVYSEMA